MSLTQPDMRSGSACMCGVYVKGEGVGVGGHSVVGQTKLTRTLAIFLDRGLAPHSQPVATAS